MTKFFWAIFQEDGKLRLAETHSNYGDPTYTGPYIATNRKTLQKWCFPGDTVKRIAVHEVDLG